eukprot:5113108-Prymnesium_polylepis.2
MRAGGDPQWEPPRDRRRYTWLPSIRTDTRGGRWPMMSPEAVSGRYARPTRGYLAYGRSTWSPNEYLFDVMRTMNFPPSFISQYHPHHVHRCPTAVQN